MELNLSPEHLARLERARTKITDNNNALTFATQEVQRLQQAVQKAIGGVEAMVEDVLADFGYTPAQANVTYDNDKNKWSFAVPDPRPEPVPDSEPLPAQLEVVKDTPKAPKAKGAA